MRISIFILDQSEKRWIHAVVRGVRCVMVIAMVAALTTLVSCIKEESPIKGMWEVESVSINDGSIPDAFHYGFFRPGVRWYFSPKGQLVIGGGRLGVSEYGVTNPDPPSYGSEQWVASPTSVGDYSVRHETLKAWFEYYGESYELEGEYQFDNPDLPQRLVVEWKDATCAYKFVNE